MALALRHGADCHFDDAFRLHHHFGLLARRAGGSVDVIGDTDAATFAARFRLGAAGREALPIAEPQHPLHAVVVLAAVVDHTERVGVGHRRYRNEIAAAELDAVDAGLFRGEVD